MNELATRLASSADARAELSRCCGATRWVEGMLARLPFTSDDALLRAAADVWKTCDEGDIREAFAHHPRIGEDLAALRARFESTASWAGDEQAGVAMASDELLHTLREANAQYEARFGYIFVVCATGKTAPEMLAIIRARLPNEPVHELAVAAAEQAKITQLRLKKLAP